MSLTAISFYWRNDTPSFVTWRSRLATAPYTPTCIVIHGGQFTGGDQPPNQFVPETFSPVPCSPSFCRHTLLIVYFFKELISFIGSLDKCHTSVFNAFIIMVTKPFFSVFICKELNLFTFIDWRNNLSLLINLSYSRTCILVQFVQIYQTFPKQAAWCLRVCSTSLLKTLWEQFLLFPLCFLPVWRSFCHFRQI